MELTSLDAQSKQRVAGAEANGDDEHSASLEHAAGLDSGSTSSAENLPVSGESKVKLILLPMRHSSRRVYCIQARLSVCLSVCLRCNRKTA